MFTTVAIAPNQQLSYLEADELSSLVGKRAAHDVAAGSLVGPGIGVEAMVPATGRTVVGLSLPPGRHDLRLAWNGQDGGASGMMRKREYRIPFWFTPGIELAVPPAP